MRVGRVLRILSHLRVIRCKWLSVNDSRLIVWGSEWWVGWSHRVVGRSKLLRRRGVGWRES